MKLTHTDQYIVEQTLKAALRIADGSSTVNEVRVALEVLRANAHAAQRGNAVSRRVIEDSLLGGN